MEIQVSETYSIPFDSDFDWRVQFIRLYREFARDAAIEVIKKFKEEDVDLEWKDDGGIMRFAAEQGLFDKINEIVKSEVDQIDY